MSYYNNLYSNSPFNNLYNNRYYNSRYYTNRNRNNRNNKKNSKSLLNVDDVVESCYDNTRANCLGPTCKYNWKTKRCIPNLIKNEALCYKKNFNTCYGNCRWYGNVHKGKCHFNFKNLDELKKHHDLIQSELITLSSIITIFNKKNNSVLFQLNKEINKLRKKKSNLKNQLKKISSKLSKNNNKNNALNIERETNIKTDITKIEQDINKLETIQKKILTSKERMKQKFKNMYDIN